MSRGKGKRTQALVEAAYRILREIQPCSVRAVCYRLLPAFIPNMRKSATNSVGRVLRIAREEGQIPWAWIVDESREAEDAGRWNNPDEMIRCFVGSYRRDYWQAQEYHVEVWSEKGTVRGTLAPVLDEYGVTLRVHHGYASATVINDIAERSRELANKTFISLYVGDWDPSGKHMSDVDLPQRLQEYGADVELVRVALQSADLRGLPSFSPESKRQDPRYRWFRKTVGTRCYELDAMSPPELRSRVEQHIRSYIDLPKWDHARMVEAAEVQSMRDFHKSWRALISERRA